MIIWEPGLTMEIAERQILWQALTHFCGNKVRAAKALGICTKTMQNKIATYPELEKFKGRQGRRQCTCGRIQEGQCRGSRKARP
jgi:hypothetical protein